MTRFWLIHHGCHDSLGKALVGRQPGILLNGRGHYEAEVIAGALSSRPFAAIYSSPMERAQQTAAPLAARKRLPIYIDEDLQEIDFGDWCGASLQDLSADSRWHRWKVTRATARPPGARECSTFSGGSCDSWTFFHTATKARKSRCSDTTMSFAQRSSIISVCRLI
jgi:broad specificity phosphatase PhoE